MKKPSLKRFALGLLQHFIAALIMVALAGILFNSYLGVESMKESRVYWLAPLDTEPEFEDSQVFRDMVSTAASDIIEYVAIKEQMETAGRFDAGKRIDVARYANYNVEEYEETVTAVYRLEDLIKWGKLYGVEYTNRAMSMSEFVNYFGPAASMENFALDENGQLYFAGFLDSAFMPKIENDALYLPDENRESRYSEEEREKLEQVMEKLTVEQLEDMAYSYILTKESDKIKVSREDDGSFTIYISMLSCRYETVDMERQLTAYAGDWIEYLKLQDNVADTIERLAKSYEVYQKGQELYEEGMGNFKYAMRMHGEDGIVRTYTNISALKGIADSEITEHFSEYGTYLVCYLENLEFIGNTGITERDIYRYVNNYSYVYPEQTHIWMAVDMGYSVEGDAFYDANAIFCRIVPNIKKIIAVIIFLSLLWIALCSYLTFTAGESYDDEGEKICRLSAIDYIWTELLLLLTIALVYGGSFGISMLEEVANTVYHSHSELLELSKTKLYEYGTYGIFGAYVSLGVSIIIRSLVRRIRARILFKGSFCYWLLRFIIKGIRFVFSHRSLAVSILIPYNLFLMSNLLAVILVMMLRDAGGFRVVILILGIVLADGVVGVLLFKQNAERIDIIEGIKRIRDGEVDYKLDLYALSGTNREMADAVNNIGEGIRKAVDTSIKDEQMKSDLITNVSHDIKTPLTSIINYVDLLKRLKIEEEPAKGYIDILDSKTQRLKQLTDDLVEASKISSGNIVLNMEKLNLTELLKQTIGEFSEKLEERNLQAVLEEDIPAYIYADSRRMWRIIENLFNNICKYALENTRVYLNLSVGETIEFSIKNISERQMNMRGDELTERFIRGDSSRTTEGSGLGLFIAKSLTEVQGGTFEIQLDGDLFKVILSFPEYRAS